MNARVFDHSTIIVTVRILISRTTGSIGHIYGLQKEWFEFKGIVKR